MTVVLGLEASFAHNQNGMTKDDMRDALAVADQLREVIIFRSTGPWAKRWLEKGYPSKNFHVKGKSSDWGPHAGLVPYDGIWSKVGYDKGKAAKGTQANDDGLASRFAGKQPLVLTMEQIIEQETRPEGRPARTAIDARVPVPNSKDFILTARRSGDGAIVAFRAVHQGGNLYEIRVYNSIGAIAANPIVLVNNEAKGAKPVPLEVMTSNEVGAGMPMTGDYDLFAVCPPWGDYGNVVFHRIEKEAIKLAGADGGGHGGHGHGAPKGQLFEAETGLDKVLDPRLHTMGQARANVADKNRPLNSADFPDRLKQYEKRAALPPKPLPPTPRPFAARNNKYAADSATLKADDGKRHEHEDMGNLTPRILRCINALNAKMDPSGTKSAMRRVHHNAESHRFRAFGALSELDMNTKKDGEQYGDGFPLTVFQPAAIYAYMGADPDKQRAKNYGAVCTLESLGEFREYASALGKAGYYVPKNWIWNVESNIDFLRATLNPAHITGRARQPV